MLFEEEGNALSHDHHLWGQLIHRNNNQHQRTGLFALIKMLNRRIKTFTSQDSLKGMKNKYGRLNMLRSFLIFNVSSDIFNTELLFVPPQLAQ